MLNIKLKGTDDTLQLIVDAKKRATDYRKYFENVVTPALYKRFDEIFQREGAVKGFDRWQRLKPSTLAIKRRKGLLLNILQATGRLRRAYTSGTKSKITTTKKSLTYENLVPYGIYHEQGTQRLPQRTVIARILAYKEFRNDLTTGMSQYLLDE